MERLTDKVHQILKSRLGPGDVAVDATAGNGHDTLFLAEAVGPAGLVYAFDLQEAAIEQTRTRLEAAGWQNVKRFCCNHARMAGEIAPEHHGRIAAVTFNLGYLPGSDKTRTTKAPTTCEAITNVLPLLRCGGVLTVLAYVGHPGGLEEAEAVGDLLERLPVHEFAVMSHPAPRPLSPRLFEVVRREKPAGPEGFSPE